MKKTLFVLLISLLFGEGWGGVLLAQTPNLLVCNNKGYRLTSDVDASGVGVTYEWLENGISLGDGYTSASITIAAGKPANTYTYVRKASSTAEDCNPVLSNSYTVVVFAQPTKPIVTAPAVCLGSDVVFTVSGAGADTTYSWSGMTGGTPSGPGGSILTFSGLTAGTTLPVYATASITYTDTKACTSLASATATATVKPLPVVAPADTYTWCGTGTMVPLVVTVMAGTATVTGATINWYEDEDHEAPVNDATDYTYNPGFLTETKSYYVTATATHENCESTTNTTVTATVNLNEGSIGGEEI
jgi:hypothetical protein